MSSSHTDAAATQVAGAARYGKGSLSKSPSPERRGMRHTLRPHSSNQATTPRSTAKTPRHQPPEGSSRAAILAWSALVSPRLSMAARNGPYDAPLVDRGTHGPLYPWSPPQRRDSDSRRFVSRLRPASPTSERPALGMAHHPPLQSISRHSLSSSHLSLTAASTALSGTTGLLPNGRSFATTTTATAADQDTNLHQPTASQSEISFSLSRWRTAQQATNLLDPFDSDVEMADSPNRPNVALFDAVPPSAAVINHNPPRPTKNKRLRAPKLAKRQASSPTRLPNPPSLNLEAEEGSPTVITLLSSDESSSESPKSSHPRHATIIKPPSNPRKPSTTAHLTKVRRLPDHTIPGFTIPPRPPHAPTISRPIYAGLDLEGQRLKDNLASGLLSNPQPCSSTQPTTTFSPSSWASRKAELLRNLPPGVNSTAAQQILNEIIHQGDEVRWSDIAGLEVAKTALRETVVYPLLRPDLFRGLRDPPRGLLLFGPPGTGKTMLARAVATESKATFFAVSASSLTSKWMGESEGLVRALFAMAKKLAPSVVFVDEIDSILGHRDDGGAGHSSGGSECFTRIKTEFLIHWSGLQPAAAGREKEATTSSTDGTGAGPEAGEKNGNIGDDANRVLVLAATNLPWAIDEAARRRFVRRQYIPLPEAETREAHLRTLLGRQRHSLMGEDMKVLVAETEGFSGSDLTALAKDAAMGPLRSLGDALLTMSSDDIRPISLDDFRTSLRSIRPSVGKAGLKRYEDWARQYGERGG